MEWLASGERSISGHSRSSGLNGCLERHRVAPARGEGDGSRSILVLSGPRLGCKWLWPLRWGWRGGKGCRSSGRWQTWEEGQMWFTVRQEITARFRALLQNPLTLLHSCVTSTLAAVWRVVWRQVTGKTTTEIRDAISSNQRAPMRHADTRIPALLEFSSLVSASLNGGGAGWHADGVLEAKFRMDLFSWRCLWKTQVEMSNKQLNI